MQETIMLRKLSLVAVAVASLASVGAALAPSAASAHWHGGGGGWHGGGGGWHGGGWHGGGWHGGGWRHSFYGPRAFVAGPAYAYSTGYGGCYTRRLVPTPWGPRWRLVNRCY
jgi:hypothetical protein